MMKSDHDLVVAARAGDEQAFGEIYDRYTDRVFGLCFTVLRDRAEAEDALRDASSRARWARSTYCVD
ncbi:MAG: hypothetical protein EXQ69_06915 [Acidimicrobiia bacterium]|nr:hypothetical protein [Acidimicrobiia bacterium]